MDLLVSLGEFSGYFVQEWPDLVFWERHDPGDNPARSLGILVAERAQKNAGLVWSEDRGRATDANRGGGDHGLAIPQKRGRKPRLVKRKFSSSSRFFFPVRSTDSSSCRFLDRRSHRRGRACATTQSLQRRWWTSLIKNAHIKNQVPSTAGPATTAACTYPLLPFGIPATVRRLMCGDRIPETAALTDRIFSNPSSVGPPFLANSDFRFVYFGCGHR